MPQARARSRPDCYRGRPNKSRARDGRVRKHESKVLNKRESRTPTKCADLQRLRRAHYTLKGAIGFLSSFYPTSMPRHSMCTTRLVSFCGIISETVASRQSKSRIQVGGVSCGVLERERLVFCLHLAHISGHRRVKITCIPQRNALGGRCCGCTVVPASSSTPTMELISLLLCLPYVLYPDLMSIFLRSPAQYCIYSANGV